MAQTLIDNRQPNRRLAWCIIPPPLTMDIATLCNAVSHTDPVRGLYGQFLAHSLCGYSRGHAVLAMDLRDVGLLGQLFRSQTANLDQPTLDVHLHLCDQFPLSAVRAARVVRLHSPGRVPRTLLVPTSVLLPEDGSYGHAPCQISSAASRFTPQVGLRPICSDRGRGLCDQNRQFLKFFDSTSQGRHSIPLSSKKFVQNLWRDQGHRRIEPTVHPEA